MLDDLKNTVLSGGDITREEALSLVDAPIERLCSAADEVRVKFCGNGFDLCSIINAKCGKCSENCRYCAQSAHYSVNVDSYPLVSPEAAVEQALENEKAGILRFSLVTSGRALSDKEIDEVCRIVSKIKKSGNISVCGSFGLLDERQYRRLGSAGLERVHNNIETSRRFFPQVCTTHTFDDKLAAIRAAKSAGLSVCSGGIMGLGETFADRIDMAFELKALRVMSIPLNLLNPIKGTPMEGNKILSKEEFLRCCAIFRFVNPRASIRLAGGRALMDDYGEKCFSSGANAAITSNMLTTAGITAADDMRIIRSLGYEPRRNSNL